MWDLLIITAIDDDQAEEFRYALSTLKHLDEFYREFRIIADPTDKGKIGTAGSVIYLIEELLREYTDISKMKVLVIHSGGYSQRMSYQSLYGKIFMLLPGNTTMLEMKLRTYEVLSEKISAGMVLSAADVIEDTSLISRMQAPPPNVEMILFTTESTVETATGHGVFVLNEQGGLRCVLQKPTEEEIRQCKAVLQNGLVLTDCFHWISWNIIMELSTLRNKRPFTREMCCWADFMRPLGCEPCRAFCTVGDENEKEWFTELFSIFGKVKPMLYNLGSEAFFHFGTHSELVHNISFSSSFYTKFLSKATQHLIHSRVKHASSSCLVEFCDAPKVSMQNNVIASGLVSKKKLDIPDNLMIFSLTLEMNRYVTCAIPMGQDVKVKEEVLYWMGIECGNDIRLWDAPIFPVAASREESLDAVLHLIQTKDLDKPYELLSLKRIIWEEALYHENQMHREELRRKYK